MTMTIPTTTNSVRGYSDFFTSGFRAVATRVARRPSSVAYSISSPPLTAGAHDISSTSTARRQSFNVIPHRRARTASVIVTSPQSPPPTPEEKRQRRSSFISFSSRLFDRKAPQQSNTELSSSGWSSSRSNSRRNSRLVDGASTESPLDVWITAGGPFAVSNGSSPDGVTSLESIDPFDSSSDSKSFFIDLTETPPSPATGKRESFLSLTGSSPDPSFLHLPNVSSRRERPTSVQTMPLPSRSRRSSLQYRPSSKSSDASWIVEEEDPISDIESPVDEHGELNGIDWRQFHIDLLVDEP